MKEADNNLYSSLSEDLWYKIFSEHLNHADRVHGLQISRQFYSFFGRYPRLLQNWNAKPLVLSRDRHSEADYYRGATNNEKKRKLKKFVITPGTDFAVRIYRRPNHNGLTYFISTMEVISLSTGKVIAKYTENVPDQDLLFSLNANTHVFSCVLEDQFNLVSFSPSFQSKRFSIPTVTSKNVLFSRDFVIQPYRQSLCCFFKSDLESWVRYKKEIRGPRFLDLSHIFQQIFSSELLLDSMLLVSGTSVDNKRIQILVQLNNIHDCEIILDQNWVKAKPQFSVGCSAGLANTFATSSDNRLYCLSNRSLYCFDKGQPKLIIPFIPFLKDKNSYNIKLFSIDPDHIMICCQRKNGYSYDSEEKCNSGSEDEWNETADPAEDQSVSQADLDILSYSKDVVICLNPKRKKLSFDTFDDDEEETQYTRLRDNPPTTECFIINIRRMNVVGKLEGGPGKILVSSNGTIVFKQSKITVGSQIIFINYRHHHNLNVAIDNPEKMVSGLPLTQYNTD